MTKYFFLIILALFLAGCKKTPTLPQASPPPAASQEVPEKPSEIKASFIIFTNGTLRIFTDPRYHNKTEDLYIDPSSTNTVVVKRPNATWGDFFKTLPMQLTEDCLTTGTGQKFCNNSQNKLKFYINGQEAGDFLTRKINANDKVLISYGPQNDPQLPTQLQEIPEPK